MWRQRNKNIRPPPSCSKISGGKPSPRSLDNVSPQAVTAILPALSAMMDAADAFDQLLMALRESMK